MPAPVSRHFRSQQPTAQFPTDQVRPDQNPNTVNAAANGSDTTVSPTNPAVAGGTVVTITVPGRADNIRGVDFGTLAGTSLKILSKTQVSVVAPAQAAGAKNVVLYDGVGSVTKSNGVTYA